MTKQPVTVYLIAQNQNAIIGQIREHTAKTETGKPYFKACEKGYISLSHSGRYLATAVSDCEIGIDLQKHEHKEDDYKRIAERFFHEHEKRYVLEEDEGTLTSRFFRIWTAKESYVKFTGQGMNDDFACFSVLDLASICHFHFIEDIFDEYTLCLCTKESPDVNIEILSEE